MDKFEQIIYINIDDSGKLVNSEKVAIYAGVVFTSKKEKEFPANIPVLLHGQNQWEMTVRIGIKNNRTKDNESCVECPLIRTLHLFFFELLHIDLEKYYILP